MPIRVAHHPSMYAVGKQAEASGRGEYRKYLDAFKFQTIQFEAQQQQRAFQNAMSMAQMGQQQNQFSQQMGQQQAALQQRGTQFDQQQAYNQQLLKQRGSQFDQDFGLRQQTGQSMIDWRKQQGDAAILKQSAATAKTLHENGATTRWMWSEWGQQGAEQHARRQFVDYDEFHEWFTIQPEEVQQAYRDTSGAAAAHAAEFTTKHSDAAKVREAAHVVAQRTSWARGAEGYYKRGKAALDAARGAALIDTTGGTGPVMGAVRDWQSGKESEYDQRLNQLKQSAMKMAQTGEGLPPWAGGPETQSSVTRKGVQFGDTTFLPDKDGNILGDKSIPTPTFGTRTNNWFYGDHGPVKQAEAVIAVEDDHYKAWVAGVEKYKAAWNEKVKAEAAGETELEYLLPTIPPSPWKWDHNETVRRIHLGKAAEPKDWRRTVPNLDDIWPGHKMSYRQAFQYRDENQHFPGRSTRPPNRPAEDPRPGGPGISLTPAGERFVQENIVSPLADPVGTAVRGIDRLLGRPPEGQTQEQDRSYVPGFPGGRMPFEIPAASIGRWQRVIDGEVRRAAGAGDLSKPNYEKLDMMFDPMSQRATGKNTHYVKLFNSWWKTAVRQQSSTGFSQHYQRDRLFAKRGELALEGLRSLEALLQKFPKGMTAEQGNDPVFVRWVNVLEQAKSLLPPPSKKTPPPQNAPPPSSRTPQSWPFSPGEFSRSYPY